MISKIIRSSFAISIIALSACGGGGGSNGVATPSKPSKPSTPSAPTASYNTLASNFVEIVKEYDIDSQYLADTTSASQMPVSGKAQYIGTGSFLINQSSSGTNPLALGRAVLNADFAKKKLTGSVTNFKAKPGHTTTGGKLNINTNISGNRLSGRLTGNVNLNGRNHQIDNTAIGRFYGDDADAVSVSSIGRTKGGDSFIAAIAAED